MRYLNIREYRAAINEFLRALNLTPDDKDLYYFIGSSYHGLGLEAEAYDYYRRVDAGPYSAPPDLARNRPGRRPGTRANAAMTGNFR